MKTALDIISFISFSSNTEVSKVSSWGAVKKEALNGLNRAIRVLWNSKEWNFRRDVVEETLTQLTPYLSMPKGLIAQDGLTIDNKPLTYDKDIPFYAEAKGTPQKYYIDKYDRIRFYPQPDKDYQVKFELYDTMPVVNEEGETKATFTASSDVLNISERLEDLFIDCLSYFCNEILNGDPTDEEYQEHTLRYSEVYKLLEKADLGTYDNDESKGFKMPWQQ